MNEFLADDLPEDGEVDADDIDTIVNDWIAAHAPYCWRATGKRVNLQSVRDKLNWQTWRESETPQ